MFQNANSLTIRAVDLELLGMGKLRQTSASHPVYILAFLLPCVVGAGNGRALTDVLQNCSPSCCRALRNTR